MLGWKGEALASRVECLIVTGTMAGVQTINHLAWASWRRSLLSGWLESKVLLLPDLAGLGWAVSLWPDPVGRFLLTSAGFVSNP